MSPPIRPIVISGLPSFITNPDASVLYGRLCGSIRLALFGSSVNCCARLCKEEAVAGNRDPRAETTPVAVDESRPCCPTDPPWT